MRRSRETTTRARRTAVPAGLALGLLLAGVFAGRPAALAQPSILPLWDIVSEDFESGSLDAWEQGSPQNLYLAPGAGRGGSTALAVVASAAASYLYQTDVARAVEGYMTFWFNPNGVVIPDEGTSWVPGKSICLTAIVNSANWGLYIEQSVTADAPPENVIDGFTLEESEVAYMDSLAIRLIDWWENGADPNLFTHSGVLNTTIRNNELHHLGFRTDGDNAIDRGSTALPASLTALLDLFGVADAHWGGAYDIGRYEGGFVLAAAPSSQAIEPGGTAHYLLELSPPDLPHTVTVTLVSPSPYLTVTLSAAAIAPGAAVTLTVTDGHSGPLVPGLWYSLPITGSGGGFTQTISVRLLVGGGRVYLPLVLKAGQK
jgi:hypothetical protein